ncbi:MAG TPA: hypothetical protein VIJ12_04315 [Candidatus Baltobacteraceae bacterium]
MRNLINALVALTFAFAAAATTVPARAVPPSPTVVRLDADERAEGNRLDIARRIGDAVFRTRWSAQVTKIAADGVGDHAFAELRVSGVKFHKPLTRAEFLVEIAALAEQALASAPVDEVDVAVEVPLADREGVVVSGDLAKASGQTVFTLTVRRGERLADLLARLRSGRNVFWNEDWAKSALKVAR